jgi:hypothetical protein
MYQIESYFYPTRSMTDTVFQKQTTLFFQEQKIPTLNNISIYIIYNLRAHSLLKIKEFSEWPWVRSPYAVSRVHCFVIDSASLAQLVERSPLKSVTNALKYF